MDPQFTPRELDLTGLDRAEVCIERKGKRAGQKPGVKSPMKKKVKSFELTDDDKCLETLDDEFFCEVLSGLREDPLELDEASVTCAEVNQEVVFTIHPRPPPRKRITYAWKVHKIQPGHYVLS